MMTNSQLLESVRPSAQGIWRYQRYYSPLIEPKYQISLDEGFTPLTNFPEIAREVGVNSLFIKREDLNPTGSQKDRCAAFQTSWALQNGIKIVTISSSGNAAISTAAYCARAGIHLIANVSKNTEPQKISRMRDFGATVVISGDPIKFARYLEKVYGIVNLRPSTNPIATEGYKSIRCNIYIC
jgi:threonine synthase